MEQLRQDRDWDQLLGDRCEQSQPILWVPSWQEEAVGCPLSGGASLAVGHAPGDSVVCDEAEKCGSLISLAAGDQGRVGAGRFQNGTSGSGGVRRTGLWFPPVSLLRRVRLESLKRKQEGEVRSKRIAARN